MLLPETVPIESEVAAPAKFTVVAVELSRLKVAAEVVIPPPSTARFPVEVILPVTPRFPPMLAFFSIPTPPSTTKAPVSLFVDSVVAVMLCNPETANTPAFNVSISAVPSM